ncbi:uncharacterized protein LOC122808262 [Protopterus annectens]|uniref:uncharacterized protein LOC122808262 n=1 Tax=Protopterus annectens TaxID=7888 RepID=UPI001CFA90E7|nr:uncharacterized protein LOC122808262 [Protopterus annectens]
MSSWNTSCCESVLQDSNYTIPASYQPSAAVIILQASVMIFTVVTDIFGNILVILSVLQNKKLHTPGNVFVISLSAADLIVAVYPYPLMAIAILQKRWSLGHVQCKVSSTIMALGLSGSVYNILAIAVNRYFCICHSSKYDKIYSIKNTYCYVFLTWTLSVVMLLPLTSTDVVQYDSRVYSCVFSLNINLSLNLALASCQFIIPISIVMFCYMRIWILVIQAKYRVRRDNKQKLKFNEVRNFFTMFAVFFLFAVCWGPFTVILLAVGFSPPGKVPRIADWVTVISYFMAYFNSSLNGIIYGVFNRNFRNEYKRIVLSLCTYMLRSMSSWDTSYNESELKGDNQTEPQLYQPSAAVTIIQATVMIFTIAADIIGNILIILSVLQNKKLHTPGNAFVISLSAADLIVAVFPYPMITIAILHKKWLLGPVQCKVSSTIMALGLSGSIYNILAIAVNRYFCICHSSRYEKLYCMRNTYCYIFLIWTLSVVLLLPLTSTDVVQYDSRVYSCVFSLTTNVSLNLALASFQFIIPVSIVIFCYMRIWILVIQAKYRVKQNNKQKLKFNEVRNFLTMFAVFVLFAVCWGPFTAIGLTVSFSPLGKIPGFADWLIIMSYFMAYFNSSLNGIIYGVFNRNFRNEYKRIVLSVCTCILRQTQKMT